MATISGGDGGQTIQGGAGDDRLYGHGPEDEAESSGLIAATRVAAGLARPLFAVSPPGDPDRLFVLEKDTGRIRILDLTSNTVLSTPFLDIPDAQLSTQGERGALGLAFHPDYAANGRFFVYLTNADGDIELREYRRSSADVADPDSGRLLLTIEHSQFSNHNGGFIGFGPDGHLYVAVGDGGSSGDPFNNAQNTETLLGKILRIDVNTDDFPEDPARNYGVPADNPFVNGAGADEVWAYGLRNPFRMSFDGLTGDVYIGDVGEGRREEIDFAPAGARGLNFGWRVFEGRTVFNAATPPGPNDPGIVGPLLDYAHETGPFGGRSVTGGQVYRGPGGAQGQYVFGDFVSGNLWTVRVVDGRAEDFINRNDQLRVDAGSVNLVAHFAVDGRGRLYTVGLDGEIHRLSPSAGAGDGADAIFGAGGDDAIFGGAGDDVLDGGVGRDRLSGGFGRDRLLGGDGDDALSGGAGSDDLLGGAGNDHIGGGEGGDQILGEDGDDFMGGEDGNDGINGGAGRDVLFGDSGDDGIGGGPGDDALFGQAGADFMGGESGDDFLDGGLGDDVLFGDAGADLAIGGAGKDSLFGQAGDDILGGQEGDDFIDGNEANDRLVGDAGNDAILGGAGDDVIDGGSGADRLAGQAGSDRFVFNSVSDSAPTAADRIFDFDPGGGDLIDLSRIDADVNAPGDQAFAFISGPFTGRAGEAILAFNNGQTTLLLDNTGDAVADLRLEIDGLVGTGGGFVL